MESPQENSVHLLQMFMWVLRHACFHCVSVNLGGITLNLKVGGFLRGEHLILPLKICVWLL